MTEKRTKVDKKVTASLVVRITETDLELAEFLCNKFNLRKPTNAISYALKQAADAAGFKQE